MPGLIYLISKAIGRTSNHQLGLTTDNQTHNTAFKVHNFGQRKFENSQKVSLGARKRILGVSVISWLTRRFPEFHEVFSVYTSTSWVPGSVLYHIICAQKCFTVLGSVSWVPERLSYTCTYNQTN